MNQSMFDLSQKLVEMTSHNRKPTKRKCGEYQIDGSHFTWVTCFKCHRSHVITFFISLISFMSRILSFLILIVKPLVMSE